jgi:metal-responsive CopG/Arc/MetJ family transcriptional regulator
MARQQTLVQLTDELVDLLDEHAAREGVSRSSLIRTAVEAYLRADRERAFDDAIVRGYARIPPGELDELAEAAARRSVASEPW